MQIRIGIIAILTCAGLALAQPDQATFIKAQHDREDQTWARKSAVPVTQIRAIRIFADTTAYQIRSLDAASLKARDHILLVDIRNGCTRVSILQPNAGSFTEVWSLTDVPAPAWAVSESKSGHSKICSTYGRSATAHVTPEGRIAVEIRVLSDPSTTITPADTYLFEWSGSTYELVKTDRP